MKPYSVYKTAKKKLIMPQNWRISGCGFYVCDLTRLVEGKIDRYKLMQAVGGQANIIDNSRFSDRMSFIKDFNDICVIPFPHMNLINCVGMA